MVDRPNQHVVDIPEHQPRTTFTATAAPTSGADHTCPPAIDVQVEAVRDGIDVTVRESLLADDVDRLIQALTAARDQAVRDAETAGYYAWVKAGRPEQWGR